MKLSVVSIVKMENCHNSFLGYSPKFILFLHKNQKLKAIITRRLTICKSWLRKVLDKRDKRLLGR
jgi:hypothetical protein